MISPPSYFNKLTLQDAYTVDFMLLGEENYVN